MKKLLQLHDKYTLKFLTAGLILFTVLYPKLPSINILNTWVYIRLEDFLILGTTIIWFIQLVRKKVTIFKPMLSVIGTYWLVGLVSLVFSIIFIAPQLPQLFPHVAVLSFFRRIEYMILFFIAFSTIRSKSDIKDYFVVLAVTVFLAFLYGIGQRYYIVLWSFFPHINQAQFCFPSFQTGNEEFAKGIPLCLPPGGRITSTFGGSYDLAAYTVLVLPIIFGTFLSIRQKLWKLLTGLVFLSGVILLVLTAQRAAFVAYIIGSIFTLILYKKKWWIIPLLVVSFSFLILFSESTAKRFLSTFRVTNVVVDQDGRLVGDASIDDEIDPITKTRRPKSGQDLPEGSAFLGLVQDEEIETDTALIERTLTPEEARRLRLESGSVQISTISGSFLVRKVLVYDISFTTRFQAEWPNAWRAFQRNPALGSGYSSITLATDNDYFRALGETGLFGLFSFMGVFVMLWVVFRKLVPLSGNSITAGFAYGLAGGVIGLLVNATLIDVFEASKVAEGLWILAGVAVGSLLLYQKKKISYSSEFIKTLTSNTAYIFYLILLILFIFLPTMSNYFVADDFTWLRWAAEDSLSGLPSHFINSQGFFYRPLDKIVTYFLYTVFSFQPHGYHFFLIFLHLIAIIGVYFFAKQITKDKLFAFLVSLIFAVHPTHAENVFWYSGLSSVLSAVFIIYAAICFYRFRERKSVFSYFLAFVLSIFAFSSYEIAVSIPFLFLVIDIFLFKATKKLKYYLPHVLFILLVPFYYLLRELTNTFQNGGDYSYNLIKIVPNVMGNILGYVGMFISGESFIPVYNLLRGSLRESAFSIGIVLTVSLAAIGFLFYINRSIMGKLLKNRMSGQIMFGIAFAFFSLLPFLPLGNIAPRYLYLSSVGFSISAVLIMYVLSRYKRFLLVLVVAVIVAIGAIQLDRASDRWKDAGYVTQNTLYFFRKNYDDLKPADKIYFVDTPVTYKGIWTFPTGLNDALWFIYRDDLPQVNLADSIEDAKRRASDDEPDNIHIFRFDEIGDVSRI